MGGGVEGVVILLKVRGGPHTAGENRRLSDVHTTGAKYLCELIRGQEVPALCVKDRLKGGVERVRNWAAGDTWPWLWCLACEPALTAGIHQSLTATPGPLLDIL